MSIVDIAAPDELRWTLLRAALGRDWDRYEVARAEVERVERAAAAARAARAAVAARGARLF